METLQAKDRRTWPFFIISKAFFDLNPSPNAILAYTALCYYTHTKTLTCERIPKKTLAKRAAISEFKFERGLKELQQLGAIRMKRRSTKSKNGNRIALPNLYELLDINPRQGTDL